MLQMLILSCYINDSVLKCLAICSQAQQMHSNSNNNNSIKNT